MNDLKRLKILAAVFAVTLSLAVFTLTGGTSANKGNQKAIIAFADTASVKTVLIRNKATGTSLNLSRKDENWKVNDKYAVRDALHNLLLVGLSKMQIKREVSEQNRKSVMARIQKSGLDVQVLRDENVPLGSFSLLANETDANSCYFLAENDSIPYVVYVPGFSGNITNIFGLAESDWRTRVFYSGTEQTLEKIYVSYPDDPSNDLQIEYKDGGFHLAGNHKIDTAKFYGYVNQFARVTVNGFVTAGKDSVLDLLSTRLPLIKLKIQDLRGIKEMDVYVSPAGDALYGIIPGKEKELVTLNPKTFNPIIAGRGLFMKK